MTHIEWIDLLRAVLPDLIGLLILTAVMGSALWAVHTSPGEPAADRHFVLLVSLGGVGAVFGFGVLLRAIPGVVPTGDLITPQRVLAWLGIAWMLGLVVLVVRLALGWLAIACLRYAPSSSGPDPELVPLVRRCAGSVGLRARPPVIFARRCASPIATGIFHPAVILPASMRASDEQELRHVLTHEFAHVRRGDCRAELMVQSMGALLWWNPLYWMVARRVRVLREMVCDEIVAYECGGPERYAELLVRFAVRAMLPFGSGFAAIRMADTSSLHARVDRLVYGAEAERTRIPRVFPTTMTNSETIAFVLFAVFVIMAFDATILASLEELFASCQ